MILRELALAGAWSIEIERLEDERGYFARTFDREALETVGLLAEYPQHSIAANPRRGTLRGMHFSVRPHEETKIVRCTRGAAYDVIVDLRPTSPTYRQSLACELNDENQRAIFIPPGFAHGYQTLVAETTLQYLIAPAYAPGFAAGVRFDDPALALQWPLPPVAVSARDRAWPLLA